MCADIGPAQPAVQQSQASPNCEQNCGLDGNDYQRQFAAGFTIGLSCEVS
jgi:hypothetical protein